MALTRNQIEKIEEEIMAIDRKRDKLSEKEEKLRESLIQDKIIR